MKKWTRKQIDAELNRRYHEAKSRAGRRPLVFEWPGGKNKQHYADALRKDFIDALIQFGDSSTEIVKYLTDHGWNGGDREMRISRHTVFKMVRWFCGPRPSSRPVKYRKQEA